MESKKPLPKGKLSERLEMKGQIHKAFKVMLKLIDPKYYKDDQKIPLSLIRRAKGLVFITVLRAGFMFTGSLGAGIIICRLPNGEWSGPSSLGVAGVGFGMQIGANSTDSVIILNTDEAVKAFSGKGNIKLGGNLSVAIGPVGREGEGAVTKGSLPDSKIAACYSYSHSRGLFAGISLQGTVLIARPDDNKKFYGYRISPGYILSGNAIPPHNEDLKLLYESLERVTGHGFTDISEDVNPLSLVNEDSIAVPGRERKTFSREEEFNDQDEEEQDEDEEEAHAPLITIPTPVPASANINLPHSLSDQEYEWYCELKKMMMEKEMLNSHDAFMSFHLAQYVIATQGDGEEAIKRMTNVVSYKTKKRLALVDLDDAWRLAAPGLFLPAGYDRDKRPLVVFDVSKFVARDYATKEKVSILLRWLLNIFNTTVTNLTDFRRGLTVIIRLANLDKSNYSIKLLRNLKVKKLLSIAMDGFPLQIERIILFGADQKKINTKVINGPGKLFIPRSVRQRIEFFDINSIQQAVDLEQFPSQLGGQYVEELSIPEWRLDRKHQYQETCALLYDSIVERGS